MSFQIEWSLKEVITPLAPLVQHLPRKLGFKTEVFYMSESDPALRQRLKDLYHPQKISADCAKYKGFLAKEGDLLIQFFMSSHFLPSQEWRS